MIRAKELRGLRVDFERFRREMNLQIVLMNRKYDRVNWYLDRLLGDTKWMLEAEPGLSEDEWFAKYGAMLVQKARDNA